ncbi:hypothetical protein EVAR_81906_1 [Eumeta japonica]|uniref:Endonuclease/exonuclease/phosphatase domain-containing protein n=1 Tax=Eumeta variegata TaxID=151549 RepID=A0A4C1UYB8_EUMVA|nr:hypothetical protein EVAR_81906_1 [Eumeta japonica]
MACVTARALALAPYADVTIVTFDARCVPSYLGGDKPYWGIASSKLDYGDEVGYPSRLVTRRSATRTGEVRFGTMNMCEGMDDKIDDICELIKDTLLDILCMNDTRRKSVYAPDLSKPKEREGFWADVRDILVKCDRNERIVILGDFNDWVSVQWDGYEKVLVRNVVCDEKKTWLGLLSAKANHEVQRKDILKNKLKYAESTYIDAK